MDKIFNYTLHYCQHTIVATLSIFTSQISKHMQHATGWLDGRLTHSFST